MSDHLPLVIPLNTLLFSGFFNINLFQGIKKGLYGINYHTDLTVIYLTNAPQTDIIFITTKVCSTYV